MTQETGLRFSWRAWLELFRVPNLLTVPGDPLVGYLLASFGGLGGWGPAAAPVAASLCFYGAGLLLNDLADIRRDRIERPARPLPSGRVRPAAAWVAALLLCASAMALCTLAGPLTGRVGLALLIAIWTYNFAAKSVPVWGPAVMGLCRALSLLLGAAAMGCAFPPAVWAAAAVLFAYILAVTQLARHEMAPQRMGRLRSWPAGIMAAGLLAFAAAAPPGTSSARIGFIVAFLCALAGAVAAAWRLILHTARLRRAGLEPAAEDKSAFPAAIGLLIGNLLFIQAAFCMAASRGGAGLIIGWVLLALWPVNRMMCGKFYAS